MLLRAGCLNLIGNYVNSFDKAFIMTELDSIT